MNSLQNLINTVSNIEANDVTKFKNGNSAAGVRLRKRMQKIKHAAQAVRDEIQEIRQQRKADKKK